MYREVSYGTENLDYIMCPFCGSMSIVGVALKQNN